MVFFRSNNTSRITNPCASTNRGLIILQSQPRPTRHAQDAGSGADEDFSFLALVYVTICSLAGFLNIEPISGVRGDKK